jgi:uncharacterized protein with GYD domain
MAKYAFLGGYTAEAWKGMIDNPESRKGAIQKAAQAVGASLDAIYWTFGDDDFLVIIEAPDDAAAAAIGVGVASSGALRNTRTIKLIGADEQTSLLGKAQKVIAEYVPPGARKPVGVG